MIYRSKAPLRIGLAGGGTDVSPYADLYGGAILNATINLYAYAHLEPLESDEIILHSFDTQEEETQPWSKQLILDDQLTLLKGVYNYLQQRYTFNPKGFRLSTFSDAPPGSGLGSSSTMVVAIIGAFAEMFNLPLGEYDMAHMAFEIERTHLLMPGGRQDHYAATFGGFNFMEFSGDDKVIVNPLRIKQPYIRELENNLLLYYTRADRNSKAIIEEQCRNVREKQQVALEAMHELKAQAVMMKDALLKGNLDLIGEILDFGFEQKRKMASGISNPMIEEIYELAKKAGATGGKISGAGGGGFMIFYCPANTRYQVIEKLNKLAGYTMPYQFTHQGLSSWSI